MLIPVKTGIQLLPEHTLVIANHNAATEQVHFMDHNPSFVISLRF